MGKLLQNVMSTNRQPKQVGIVAVEVRKATDEESQRIEIAMQMLIHRFVRIELDQQRKKSKKTPLSHTQENRDGETRIDE